MAHDIRDGNYDFHLVTHLMNSLLGLAVVPRVKHVEDEFWRASLQDLVARGWPEWNIPLDKPGKGRSNTKTLGRLTTHLRNAAAQSPVRHSGSQTRCYPSEAAGSPRSSVTSHLLRDDNLSSMHQALGWESL